MRALFDPDGTVDIFLTQDEDPPQEYVEMPSAEIYKELAPANVMVIKKRGETQLRDFEGLK